MKAIRVHQFGDPSVMKLEEVPDQICRRGTGAGRCQGRRRQSRRHIHPQRAVRVRCRRLPYTPGADAAGRGRSGGQRGVQDFKAGDRVYVSGRSTAARLARTRQQRRVHDRSGSPSPEPCHVCRRGRRRRPVCHGVAGALRQRAGGPGRDGPDPRRERRRRRRRRADGERRRTCAYSARPAPSAADSLRASRARTRCSITRLPATRKRSWQRPADAASISIIEMLANVNLVRDLDLIAKRGRIVDRWQSRRARAESARDHGQRRHDRRPHELERAAGRARHRACRDCGRHGAQRDTSRRSARKCHSPMRRARTRTSSSPAPTEKLCCT